jgi:hypothetical protein
MKMEKVMDENEIDKDSRERLIFAGYALAYGQHLYAGGHVQPHTLCQLLLQQQGVKRYVGFESDSVLESFHALYDYLEEVEVSEGFEIAAIIMDGYAIQRDSDNTEDYFKVIVLDRCLGYEYRDLFCTYTRKHGEFIPSDTIHVGNDWPEPERKLGYPWMLRGLDAFHQDHDTVM